jgi:hypothetical protein
VLQVGGRRPPAPGQRHLEEQGGLPAEDANMRRAADAQSGCANDMDGRPEGGHGEPFRWIVQQGAGGFSRRRIPYTLCIFICYYILPVLRVGL